MIQNVMIGILIPLIGTSLGAALVFILRKEMSEKIRKILTGFAAGVMVAASFFSLLLPSIEQSSGMGNLAFIPAVVGFLVGMGFLLALDVVVPHMHMDNQNEGMKSTLSSSTKLILAVTLHNIPEGMAVGVVYAGWMAGNATVSLSGALALAIGIAIQNFPEGAVVSTPLLASGMSKTKTFLYGVLSGVVEPIASIVTIVASSMVIPILPYLLSFAAGAMLYVVIEELVPEMAEGKHSNIGAVSFAVGFALMMVLDVALG